MRGPSTSRVEFSPATAAVLNAAADRIVPADGRFPAPSAVRVVEDFMTRYVAPDDTEILYPPFVVVGDIDRLIAALGDGFAAASTGTQVDALIALQQSDPELFEKLRTLVYHGYYSRPDVRTAIATHLPAGADFRGRPQPYGYADVIEPWDLSLLADVRGDYTATEDIMPVDRAALDALVATWPAKDQELGAMNGTDEQTDVLIIGAGQAGAALSQRLGAAGIGVICLEQGDWVGAAEFPHFEDEWELEKTRRWAFSPNIRQLPEDYPVTGATFPMMFNAVGGSTVHYLAGWPRFRTVDFRKGTEHGLAGSIDWPFAYEDLAPYYEAGDAAVGISGFTGDPMYPSRSERDGPAIHAGKIGLRAAEGFQRLGWHWWPGDNAILTNPRPSRLACNACGNCIGCPRGSLGSADHTFWPDALRSGVRLRTNARVSEITVGAHGRATGATYVDRTTGDGGRVRAGIVMLCANGIGSPRLLLMSAQNGHPDGLANGTGNVGRYLTHHTYGYVDAFFDEPTEGYKGAFGATIGSQQFYETDLDREFVNGFTLFAARSSGAVTAAHGNIGMQPVPWGAEHRQAFDGRFGHHMALAVQGEDLPRADNRVTLDPDVVDSSGLAAPHVDYTLCENDVRLTEFGLDRAEEAAAAMGASRIERVGVAQIPPAWHLMGTCRIGNSPQDSVANAYHQTWEVPNLFVVDGSSLPTAASANPTSTITALALRCADYVIRRHRDILDQTTTPPNADAPTL